MNPQLVTKQKVIINTSTSKQMYGFGKATRFGFLGRKEVDNYYHLPTTFSKRATSLGKGHKSDFTSDSKGKTQAIYDVPREFDLRRKNSPQYTFGLGRDVCRQLEIGKHNVNPAPNSYKPYTKFGYDAKKFSLFGRGWANKTTSSSSRSPGPGEYKYPAINDRGKYPTTTLNNTTQNAFSRADRFHYAYSKTPAPTEYNIKTFFNNTGKHYVSNYESSVAKTMASRHTFGSNYVKNMTPGPGSYDYFSDFEGFKR